MSPKFSFDILSIVTNWIFQEFILGFLHSGISTGVSSYFAPELSSQISPGDPSRIPPDVPAGISQEESSDIVQRFWYSSNDIFCFSSEVSPRILKLHMGFLQNILPRFLKESLLELLMQFLLGILLKLLQ